MPPQLIAERLLHAAEAPTKTIHVKLYAPENIPDERDPEHFPWRCAFALAGIPPLARYNNKTSWAVTGIDSLDALLGALSAMRGILDACFEELGLQFTWDRAKNREGGFGIPYPIVTYLGPSFERHVIEIAQREQLAFILREREFMARLRGDPDDSADED
jgi:hypothetical protein